MRERRSVYRVLLEIVKERNHLQHPGLDERIILRWIFRDGHGRHGLDRSGSR
jgi:hypothetical protein